MVLNIVLVVITLVVAVTGTLLKDPPNKIKALLIVLAVAACIGSIVKASKDADSEAFMKAALVSTLRPSPEQYDAIMTDVIGYGELLSLDNNNCIHNEAGMACHLWPSSNAKLPHDYLVLDSSDVAQMYADILAKKQQSDVPRHICSQEIDPTELQEGYKLKVGVLGSTIANFLTSTPSTFYYDNDIGVQINYSHDKTVIISIDELKSFHKQSSCTLFHDVSLLIDKKIHDADPTIVVSDQ